MDKIAQFAVVKVKSRLNIPSKEYFFENLGEVVAQSDYCEIDDYDTLEKALEKCEPPKWGEKAVWYIVQLYYEFYKNDYYDHSSDVVTEWLILENNTNVELA